MSHDHTPPDRSALDPILLDLPTHIHTDRLLIRAPQVGDGIQINAAIRASFANLKKWLPWADSMPTPDESEIAVRKDMARWILRESLRFYAFSKDNGTLAGSVAIHEVNWDLPAFQIGYWGNAQQAGQGYMTEATAAATRYAFDYLNAVRLEICCDPDNGKSQKIPQRLHYILEGNLRYSEPKEDGSGIRDTLIFARYDAQNLPDMGFSA